MPTSMYTPRKVVLRSPIRGETWENISPDLTVNDPAKRGGGGNITYATITTIDESPIVPGLLVGRHGRWQRAGHEGRRTDVDERPRQDSGTSGLLGQPRRSVASQRGHGVRHDDGPSQRRFPPVHLEDDGLRPDVDVDRRKSAAGSDQRRPRGSAQPELAVRRHGLGVQVTLDARQVVDGAQGRAAPACRRRAARAEAVEAPRQRPVPRGVLPTVPVHDLKIHPRDRELIVGTHGRGIWIADISPIEELTPRCSRRTHTCSKSIPVIQWDDRRARRRRRRRTSPA